MITPEELERLRQQRQGVPMPTPTAAGTKGGGVGDNKSPTAKYPAEDPREGFRWVRRDRGFGPTGQQGGWVEEPLPAKTPPSVLLQTYNDARGLVEQYGFLDKNGVNITKVVRTPPPKGQRMVWIPTGIDPIFGDETGFWNMEPDLPPGMSLEQMLQEALLSGDPKRIAEVKTALADYQDTINALTPAQRDAVRQYNEKRARDEADERRRQHEWELGQAATAAERRAIQDRFDRELARNEQNENRRRLEWEMNFAATEQERQVARQQWEASFQQTQYEFNTSMAQRQWEASQTANREALELGLKIQQSPGDWLAYQKLLRGNQPNVPYEGQQAIPRTWADPWMQFANKPMPALGQPRQGGVPPLTGAGAGAGKTYTEAELVALAASFGDLRAKDAIRLAAGQAADKARQRAAGLSGDVPTLPTEPGLPIDRVAQYNKAIEAQNKATLPSPGDTDIAAELQALAPLNVVPPPPPPREKTAVPPLYDIENETEDERKRRLELEAIEGVPLYDSPGEAPFSLPALRYEAKRGKELAIINERELPAFIGAGFSVTRPVKLYDAPPWWNAMLPRRGLRQAFGGVPVGQARQLPTLGAPSFPSAQSWANLLPSEQEMFRGEIRTQGFPEQDYWAQWARTQPQWGTPARFRRLPQILGAVGG